MKVTLDPLEVLRKLETSPRLLEDNRPLTESLEWRLSELYWNTAGTRGFVRNEVPYTVTSSGTLSAYAAGLLYANCCEHPPEGSFQVLEIGSGTGLFARLFLDEFARLCQRGQKTFHERIVFYVTDRSQRSVKQWKDLGLFEAYPNSVAAVSDALDPLPVSGVRAVFCNYSLDSLPASVLRQGEAGPEELFVRTHLAADDGRVSRRTKLSLAEIKELARDLDDKLIPLVSLFEFEVSFQPCQRAYPNVSEALTFGHGWPRFILNHGAIKCLEQTIEGLNPHGFVLVNDYGVTKREDVASLGGTQRFGPSAALGLNFPFLEHHFSGQGTSVLTPELDERLPIHPRLFTRAPIPETRRAFHAIFDFEAQRNHLGPQERAREHVGAGRLEAARKDFEAALSHRPNDWVLLGEIAEFTLRQVGSYQAALELISAALAINPWYSMWLWNVYGDALYALGRFSEAHEAYLKAAKMEPADVRTHLNLGYSYTQLGDPESALQALARGLANDSGGAYRERLLEKQQQILTFLQARTAEEQDWLARRAARIENC